MAMAPECANAIYSCSRCGVRFSGINASFRHRCPFVTSPTLDTVTETLREAKVKFDWVRIIDGDIIVTMPDHSDSKNNTKPYARAQKALMAHGWKITRERSNWKVWY